MGETNEVAACFLSSSSVESGQLQPGLALTCRLAESSEDLSVHHAIRHAVFVEEQGIFEQTDRDERDVDTATIKILGAGGRIAGGAVRLYPLDEAGLWRGDRLAVLPAFRRLGLGAPLVRYAVWTASELGGESMIAHIQPQNVEFFRKLGWRADGRPEAHVGLPHQRMTISLGAHGL